MTKTEKNIKFLLDKKPMTIRTAIKSLIKKIGGKITIGFNITTFKDNSLYITAKNGSDAVAFDLCINENGRYIFKLSNH